MIAAEKIMKFRKQKGWSQEDLDKIIKLSSLFGVSTDYLLKDDIEEEPGYEAAPAVNNSK